MLLRAARAYAASDRRDFVIPDDVKALALPVLGHRIIVTADASMNGRDYVVPDDVKGLAAPTLAHRLILQPQARLKDLAATTVIAEILASVPVESTSAQALRT